MQTMSLRFLLLLVSLSTILLPVVGFISQPSLFGRATEAGCSIPTAVTTTTTTIATKSSTTSLSLIEDPFVAAEFLSSTSHTIAGVYRDIDPEQAQAQFFFFFFAGSGAGGLGLAQVPRIYGELQAIRGLGNQGPTLGGDALSTNAVVKLFYPDPISQKDVEAVIQTMPSGETIAATQGSSSTSYFARMGYVVPADFERALAGCNPLAVNAAFEALSGGSGKAIPPDTMDDKVAVWKQQGASAFGADLTQAALAKVGAYFGLVFLLLFTVDIVVETGINAFL